MPYSSPFEVKVKQMAASKFSLQYFESITAKHSNIEDSFSPFVFIWLPIIYKVRFVPGMSEHAKTVASSQKPLNIFGCHLNYDFENEEDKPFYSDRLVYRNCLAN